LPLTPLSPEFHEEVLAAMQTAGIVETISE
jgi:hypothetical protein